MRTCQVGVAQEFVPWSSINGDLDAVLALNTA